MTRDLMSMNRNEERSLTGAAPGPAPVNSRHGIRARRLYPSQPLRRNVPAGFKFEPTVIAFGPGRDLRPSGPGPKAQRAGTTRPGEARADVKIMNPASHDQSSLAACDSEPREH